MWLNIFSMFSLGKDRSYLFPADVMALGDIIGETNSVPREINVTSLAWI